MGIGAINSSQTDMVMESYKFAPLDALVGPQILSEVVMHHVLENESQRVLGGGVHSYEWHDIPVPETTTLTCLSAEFLPIGFQLHDGTLRIGPTCRVLGRETV